MNGPTSNIVKNIPLSATTLQQQQQQQQIQPQNSGEQLSTLKNIAQEVINRNSLDAPTSHTTAVIGNISSTINNNIAPSQQQQQSTIQPPQPDTRQGSVGSTSGFTNDTTATNGPNLTTSNVTGRESAKQLSTVGSTTITTTTTAVTNEAHIPPLLGVAPLGPSPLQKEHQIQVRKIEIVIKKLSF